MKRVLPTSKEILFNGGSGSSGPLPLTCENRDRVEAPGERHLQGDHGLPDECGLRRGQFVSKKVMRLFLVLLYLAE